MRVTFWRDGGEPRPTRIATTAPCHRFRRAGINTFQWPFLASAISISAFLMFVWRGGRCTDVAAVTENTSQVHLFRPIFIHMKSAEVDSSP